MAGCIRVGLLHALFQCLENLIKKFYLLPVLRSPLLRVRNDCFQNRLDLRFHLLRGFEFAGEHQLRFGEFFGGVREADVGQRQILPHISRFLYIST